MSIRYIGKSRRRMVTFTIPAGCKTNQATFYIGPGLRLFAHANNEDGTLANECSIRGFYSKEMPH